MVFVLALIFGSMLSSSDSAPIDYPKRDRSLMSVLYKLHNLEKGIYRGDGSIDITYLRNVRCKFVKLRKNVNRMKHKFEPFDPNYIHATIVIDELNELYDKYYK